MCSYPGKIIAIAKKSKAARIPAHKFDFCFAGGASEVQLGS